MFVVFVFIFIVYYLYCHWGSNYHRSGITLTGLSSPHFCTCPKLGPWISNAICGGLFSVFNCSRWKAAVRFVGGINCWPSLFNHLFPIMIMRKCFVAQISLVRIVTFYAYPNMIKTKKCRKYKNNNCNYQRYNYMSS